MTGLYKRLIRKQLAPKLRIKWYCGIWKKNRAICFHHPRLVKSFIFIQKSNLLSVLGFWITSCNQRVGKHYQRRICAKVHLNGKFTNYSLHTTSARKIFDQDVTEHTIKGIASHKSECVRTCKFTSNSIREYAMLFQQVIMM